MQLTSNFVILASALATSVLALPVANPSYDLDAREVDIDLVTREVADILDIRAVSAPSTPTNSRFGSDVPAPSDRASGESRFRNRPARLNEDSLNSYRDGPRSGGLGSSRLDRYGGQSPYSGRLGSSRGELSPLRTGDSEYSSLRSPKSVLSPTTPKSASKLDSEKSLSKKKSDVSKTSKAKAHPHHKKSRKEKAAERKAKRAKRKADRKAKADKKKADRKAKHDKKKADRKAKHDKKKADRDHKKADKKAKLEKKKSDSELSKKAKTALKDGHRDGLRSASLDSPRLGSESSLRSPRPYDNFRESESSRYGDSPRTGGFRDGGRRFSDSYENADFPRGGGRTAMY